MTTGEDFEEHPAMDDDPQQAEETSPEAEGEQEQQAPYIIEGARSSRARCKSCRKKIDKGILRLGVLVHGPYGPGYMWHHLRCAAARMFDKVEEAYQLEAWKEAAEEPEVPTLDSLRQLREKAAERKANRKRPPYAERAPSGRSSCKHCGETIEKGAWRVVLGREVQFGNQIRTAPINVLPGHVSEVLAEPDCATKAEDLFELLESNSGLEAAELAELLEEIGPLA